MIVYDLLCENAHRFEGWFASAEAFVHQHEAGQLSCPLCGSSSVRKQPSAPYVQSGAVEAYGADTVLAHPQLLEEVRKRLVEVILQHTEDVGERFPKEARAIHYNEVPERAIRGKATSAEAQALRDEGIDVFALPVPALPKDKLH